MSIEVITRSRTADRMRGAGVPVALSLALAFLILYPIGHMLVRAFRPEGSWELSAFTTTMGRSWFSGMVVDTLSSLLLAGLLALVVASVLAWVNERTDASMGVFGDVLPLIPLLLPAVAMSIGWVFLAHPRVGLLNGLLSPLASLLGRSHVLNIHSFPGLVFVYAMYFVPYIYLLVVAALRNMDTAYEEASLVSGASLLTTLRRVSLPAVKPALVGGWLLVVVVGLALYSVPVVVATPAGLDILSVRIIRSLTFQFPPETDVAVALGALMLIVIAVAWVIQRRVVGSSNFATVGSRAAQGGRIELGRWRWVARSALIGYIILSAVLPVLALVLVSLQPFWAPVIDFSTLTLDHYTELLSHTRSIIAMRFSLTLALIGGVIGIVVAAILAISARRFGGPVGGALDGVSKLPAVFSNLVIAVGFLFAFGGDPFNLGGTLWILLAVYIVIYMPQASIAAGTALAQVGGDLTEASVVSGANETTTLRRITLPLMRPGLVAGWSLLFVLMAAELAASRLLASVNSPVIGFMLLEQWEYGTFGGLAALATAVTVITCTVVAVALRASQPKFRRVS